MTASNKYTRLDRTEVIAVDAELVSRTVEHVLSLDSDNAERQAYDAYASLVNSRKSMTRMIKRANLVTTDADTFDNRVIGMIVGVVQMLTMSPTVYRAEVQQFLGTVLHYVEDARDDIADSDVSSPTIDHTLEMLHIIEKLAMLTYEKPAENNREEREVNADDVW